MQGDKSKTHYHFNQQILHPYDPYIQIKILFDFRY